MKKYIKDNIYGFIKTDLIKIIDNPIFQRLRYIKQNGFCYLIYPCANHTRFEHSLGCFYLTNEAMTKMKDLNKDEREKLRICSLIHDIGHGPFSHISEETLGLNHEKQLFKLLKQILEDTNYSESEIKKVFKSEKFDLVSGDFGTDRLDYLLRDSHNTGVSYGLIDWQLLIKEIKYIDRKYAFNKKIESSLDNIILARHFMFSNVYAHKTAIKTDEMFKEAIKELLNYFNKNEIFFMNDYELMYNMKKFNIKIFEDILNRRFWRDVFSCSKIEEIPEKYFSDEYIIAKKKIWKTKLNTWLYDHDLNLTKYNPDILEYLNKKSESKIYILKKVI